MYCHHCIRSFADDAVFCSQCGRRLHAHKVIGAEEKTIWTGVPSEEADLKAEQNGLNEAAQAAVDTIEGGNKEQVAIIRRAELEAAAGNAAVEAVGRKARSETGISWGTAAALSVLALGMAVSLYFYYQYEQSINERVLKLQSDAKVSAMSGDYNKALDLLTDASAERPDFAALAADQAIIHHVMKLEGMAADVEGQLLSGNIIEAEELLDKLKSDFNGHKEPIYGKLREKLEGLDMKLTVLNLESELDSLTNVKDLGEMLNVVNGLAGEDASTLQEQIVNRIRTITSDKVEDLIHKRKYTNALESIGYASTWLKDDAVLKELSEDVKNAQQRYEQAEQQRIEQAMQRAAEEDLVNQTAAVKQIDVDLTLDEFGDLTIEGTLMNVATRPIYSIKVNYIVKNSAGEKIAEGTADATPNYVEPGEEMTYTATVYGAQTDQVTVEMDHATWYLD
ncbi:FxLYD domain-containing protein [Paenibacillus sp. J5C_2022]|uniref:FxLYD domain-containing protein n=1 Tax=Paenibacillus sp. J5C2022 TaxID=2977129 RepID=UPI0021D1B50F|nr:FxLYD domain-containing protein [Paenibacillus sp. J5C2022]MCU6712330.1 FxLYD domain-containing protein [Paenibacillus sp. J5C2022]